MHAAPTSDSGKDRHPGRSRAQQAFDIASYGRQLGLITDVLLDLVQRDAPTSARGSDALAALRQVRDDIDALKATEYKASADALAAQIEALQARGGAEYAAFVRRIAPLLPLLPPALPSLPDAAP